MASPLGAGNARLHLHLGLPDIKAKFNEIYAGSSALLSVLETIDRRLLVSFQYLDLS